MFWETFVSINTRICQGPKKCHDHSKINVFTNKFLEEMLLKCVNAKRKCIIAIAFFFVWMKGVNQQFLFSCLARMAASGVLWCGVEWIGVRRIPEPRLFRLVFAFALVCLGISLSGSLPPASLLSPCIRVSEYLSLSIWRVSFGSSKLGYSSSLLRFFCRRTTDNYLWTERLCPRLLQWPTVKRNSGHASQLCMLAVCQRYLFQALINLRWLKGFQKKSLKHRINLKKSIYYPSN